MADEQTVWHMKSKEFSGEMYDLTASSSISGTGQVKFEQAKKNGISDTFYKYIHELQYMTDDQTDDKFYKRQQRLNFLQNCQNIDKLIMNENNFNDDSHLKQPNLEKLFSFTCNYLNGNNGINQHKEQPIIVILSGGNVTTIYINLLKNLLENTEEIQEFVTKYFHGIGGTSNIKILKILHNITE
jgi:nucleotidyltransferase/DNA polymerase involved in DNA repair